jgi:N-methylhydantoinase A
VKRVGVDVGGTFTDFAFVDSDTGMVVVHKELTTPYDPAVAVLRGLEALLSRAESSYGTIDLIIHATTLATNAVLERRGSAVALVTTNGFRDVIQIQRQKRHQLYNLFESKPAPLVMREDVYTIDERVDASGSIVRAMEEGEIAALTEKLREGRYPAVAVALINSYANPIHEELLGDILRRDLPGSVVTLSCNVAPIIREYERTNTTVVNAYVLPVVGEYIKRLMGSLESNGYRKGFYVLNSGGGLMTGEAAAEQPVRIIESGPAAGALLASRVAEKAGFRDAVAFDMGGTSAKVCVIEGGKPTVAQSFEIERSEARRGSGLPIAITAVDLLEIGRGGGSIASAAGGFLNVGPGSAGADPGPACYGRGGCHPTVTDSDLILGYVRPDYFLGGRMQLDVEAAREAIRREVAEPLGVSVVEAAWGIHELVNAGMANAARLLTIRQGRDPRAMPLVAFGGAGPLHASRIAEEIGFRAVIVPPAAGVSSAIGLLAADVSFDFGRSAVEVIDGDGLSQKIAQIYKDMHAEGERVLSATGVGGEHVFEYAADLRYCGQGYEVTVTAGQDWSPWAPRAGADLVAAFHRRYQEIYGYAAAHRPVEGVTWRIRSRSPMGGKDVVPRKGTVGDTGIELGDEECYFRELGGYVTTQAVYRWNLGEDSVVEGPAVIREVEATTVVLPGQVARLDGDLNLVLSRSTREPKVL